MKVKVKRTVEVDVQYVRVVIPVRCSEDDIPADLFGRTGDTWDVTINIDGGKIVGWQGPAFKLDAKVCDEGSYYLLDKDLQVVGKREQDYVPDVIPGDYGDYIELDIDEAGIIRNWDSRPDVIDILGDEDEQQKGGA